MFTSAALEEHIQGNIGMIFNLATFEKKDSLFENNTCKEKIDAENHGILEINTFIFVKTIYFGAEIQENNHY